LLRCQVCKGFLPLFFAKFLVTQIQSQAKAYGVGWVTPSEIDKLGLTKSVQLAMLRAMKKLHETTTEYDEIIIDGNVDFFASVKGLSTGKISAVVRADDTVPAVSAASILAKVARDDYMAQMSHKYSGYGFEKHVGYGTAAHVAALKQYGITDLHRKSFRPIQKFL
jgi:ribonuclease HII